MGPEVHPDPSSRVAASCRVGDKLHAATLHLARTARLPPAEARLEARLLAARALNVNRAWLVAHDLDLLSAAQEEAIDTLVSRRAQGEPVAYILGEREFYGRMFRVGPYVLIPRPETELLVEAALERMPSQARILDLGTGSGCIGLTLALERPDCRVLMTDVSPEALGIAGDNARRLGAANCVFRQSSWFSALPPVEKFDIIVSNPPYIADQHPNLADLGSEPSLALVSGGDGLTAIREIVRDAGRHLNPGGWLMFEHGYDQGEACQGLLSDLGYGAVETRLDLAGLTRIAMGRN